jgi:hypothetical protein
LTGHPTPFREPSHTGGSPPDSNRAVAGPGANPVGILADDLCMPVARID